MGMASPTATRPPISLARGALSPMALELPSTLDMPPAMLAQPPMACPIFSMARGAPMLMLTLMLMPMLMLMLMPMPMPIMATMAMATVTPTMVMATAMASPTGDRCIQMEKERRKSCDVEFCFPVKMSDNYQK